jgi:hypothetical protein
MKKQVALLIFYITMATAHVQAQTETAQHDSTTGSTIRWDKRKFEQVYTTEKGGKYLARTQKGIYFRYFIKGEEQPTNN